MLRCGRHGIHRFVEHGLVMRRRVVESAHLAHVLKGGRTYVIGPDALGKRLTQGLDAPAHNASVRRSREAGAPSFCAEASETDWHAGSKIARMAKKGKKAKPVSKSVSDLLRVPPGPVDLKSIDARATPGFSGDKVEAREW